MWLFLTVFSFLLAVISGELIVRAGAAFMPGVKYRATAGRLIGPKEFKTLEDFLARQSQHLKPHRNWHNHLTNSLGFYDEEFEIPKPDGRFRIMALGDSFCYSVVPYPNSLLTLVEDRLAKACNRPDFDLLNFGIGGTGLWEYKTLLQLGHFSFKPDLVVIHFYMGNDGPDIYRHDSDLSELKMALLHSYFFTYIKNFFKTLRGLNKYKLDISAKPFSNKNRIGVPLRGGSIVDPASKATDDHPVLAGPTFNEETFNTILAEELGRLYAPGEIEVKKEWGPVLNVIEEIRKIVTNNKMKIAIVLLPSVLQVYPEEREVNRKDARE